MPRLHLAALLGAASLVALGIILGAAVQYEEILQTDVQDRDRELARPAAGNLIPLTALLCGVGTAGTLAAIGRAPAARRAGGAAAAGAAAYLAVQLVQTAFPSYVAIEGSVAMSLSLLASNAHAAPTVLVPVLAAVAGCIWVLAWGARRALGGRRPSDLAALARRFTGRALFATPFLAVAAWGPVRLMAGLEPGSRHVAGHVTLLSVQVLASVGLLGVLAVQAWHVRDAVEDARVRGYVAEVWGVSQTLHLVLGGILLALPAAALLLAPVPLEALHAGTAFGTTLRSHHALMATLAIPLAPAWAASRAVMRRLDLDMEQLPVASAAPAAPAAHAARVAAAGVRSHEVRPAPVWDRRAAPAAMAASFAIGGALAMLAPGALWAWLGACVAVLAAGRWAGPVASAACLLMAAYVAWAMGNTITAGFHQRTDITIRFDVGPGRLALWRLLAVALGAAAVARLWLHAARGPAAGALRFAVPAAVALALAALMELPLSAWTVQTMRGEAVGLGSLPASQDAPVRAIMHAVGLLGFLAAGWCLARLHRPEWSMAPRSTPP